MSIFKYIGDYPQDVDKAVAKNSPAVLLNIESNTVTPYEGQRLYARPLIINIWLYVNHIRNRQNDSTQYVNDIIEAVLEDMNFNGNIITVHNISIEYGDYQRTLDKRSIGYSDDESITRIQVEISYYDSF